MLADEGYRGEQAHRPGGSAYNARVRVSFVVAIGVLAFSTRAWAVCFAPGPPACLPDDPLKAAFVEAERQVECHDVLRVDEEGRDLDPPRASPVAAFARKNGEAAIPFYEAVIAMCPGPWGWARPALFALAHLGTPRAIELLNRHAQTGQPVREAAVNALLEVPAFATSQSVAEHLLHEPDAELRRIYVVWLWAQGDARALPGLREAMSRENDQKTAQMIRAAILQVQHPDRCVLDDNFWRWDTLGNYCLYVCRGIDWTISRTAWRFILPCAPTVSRGHHLAAPHATLLWLVPVLLLVGADTLLRRGLAQGVVRRRVRVWRRTAIGSEAVYIGLAWCAIGMIPLGAAYVIWISAHL
jgi:hypothetical protein